MAWLKEVGLDPCHKPAVFPGRELLPCLAPPGSGFYFPFATVYFVKLSAMDVKMTCVRAGFQPLVVVVVVVVVDLM